MSSRHHSIGKGGTTVNHADREWKVTRHVREKPRDLRQGWPQNGNRRTKRDSEFQKRKGRDPFNGRSVREKKVLGKPKRRECKRGGGDPDEKKGLKRREGES